MKAISIKQPWAWAIFHGKPVENRTWATKFRGDLLIHASLNFDLLGYRWIMKQNILIGQAMPYPEEFIRGAIIGKVNMIDCVTSYPSTWFKGPYGHVYTDRFEFQIPIPFKGALKFFDVPDELIK